MLDHAQIVARQCEKQESFSGPTTLNCRRQPAHLASARGCESRHDPADMPAEFAAGKGRLNRVLIDQPRRVTSNREAV